LRATPSTFLRGSAISAPDNILLAAQPIYDTEDRVAGVELLYRSDSGLNAFEVGETAATSELLFNLCTGITDQLTQFGSPAFINVSREFLCSGAFLPLDPKSVVIELVERIEPDEAVVAAVQRWHAEGFRFALDDFEYQPAWEPLIALASIIKIDVEQTSLEQAKALRHQLRRYPVQWLAERIETAVQRDQYRAAGFDLFQGYFFARPAIVYGKKLEPAALSLAQLIGLLYAQEPDVDAITRALSSDPILSVSLIRIVNSPLYKSANSIKTMKEVVMRLGVVAIRRWAVLISSLNASSPEVARLVLTRAEACAALVQAHKNTSLDAGQAFLAGLLSGADILLGVELEVFLERLELSAEVKAAALTEDGPLGSVVNRIKAVEARLALKKSVHRLNPVLLRLYQDSALRVQSLFNELV